MTDSPRSPESSSGNPLESSDVSQIVAEAAERSQEMIKTFLSQNAHAHQGTKGSNGAIDTDPFNLGNAFFEWATKIASDPAKVAEAGFDLWRGYVDIWQNAAKSFDGQEVKPVIAADSLDRRFRHDHWNDNSVFDYIKQSYLFTSQWLTGLVRDVEGLDPQTARKMDFFTRQFIDAMSPSNFALTNPEVLQATVETRGENLVKGLQNMLDDLDQTNGRFNISMTDKSAFKIGENIAVTPGKVVFQNEMMQLIQYAPTTEKVNKRPLLIVPPWINKYYILDLNNKKSFVKWAVAQGHTVFIISWVNPRAELADKNFEDYMIQGIFVALDSIATITGEKDVNAIGYCIGGTLLGCTLAYMAAKRDKRIKSATFFTTLLDFSDPGELGVFTDESQIEKLESRMEEAGYLEGQDMANVFNMLRANDLIWSFVVNNYLLGKDPFPFDLLYWNGDSTRMPKAMHSFYLRSCYLENKLVQPGGITLNDTPIDLKKVKTPCYFLSTHDDHIAPWKSTYAGMRKFSGPVRFVLAGSGHIAGVINPPEAGKYCFWNNDSKPQNPDSWFKTSSKTEGSWWPQWHEWVSEFSDGSVAPRPPGGKAVKPLEDAPGSYVIDSS